MERRTLGLALVAIGAVLLIVGGIGLVATIGDDGDDGDTATAETATEAPTSTTTTPEPAPTTSTSASGTTSTSTTTTAPPEDVAEFMAALIAAQNANDVDFLVARLHPDSLARYGGEEACRTYLASISNPPLTLREIVGAEPWDYETDGLINSYADAIGVEVERFVGGETQILEIHLVYVDGELRWFTDCGDPA